MTSPIPASSLAGKIISIAPGDAVTLVGERAETRPVSPSGVTGSGILRTVETAEELRAAAASVLPGDVVVVKPGVYTGPSVVLQLARSGTADDWITFRSEAAWGAVIDGRDNQSAGGIKVSGRYIRVEGFQVRGTTRYGIEAYGGRHVAVMGNYIHDIGRLCTSDAGGIVGINAYVSDLLVAENVIHDIGRFNPGEQGCRPTNAHWQNHDHGIYHGEGDRVSVLGNILFGLQHGWGVHRYGDPVNELAIVGNVFVGANPNRDGQIILASPTAGLRIAANIFHGPRGAAILLDSATLTGEVVDNLVYGAALTSGTRPAGLFVR